MTLASIPYQIPSKLPRAGQAIAILLTTFATLLTTGIAPPHAHAQPVHAIAMHGMPKFSADFSHFDYVNPNAPKGGRITLAEQGTFDTLNPFIIKGVPAAGLRDFVFESLLARGRNEPFTLYGRIAQFVEVPDDRSKITFIINKNARFSDDHPIDADDVLFSWKVLRDRGRPNHRTYYKKVTRAERVSDHQVTFHFDDSQDRELPLILGLMPVLPSHLLKAETFERTTLKAPIGSGPYTITKIDAGRSLTYTRNPSWWGADLPINIGRFNFDKVRFEYYRDSSTMFEGFKSGRIDVRFERDPSLWAEGYNIKAIRQGLITKTEFDIALPAGMSALTMNTRRKVFNDPRVRKALIYMFDFQWINKNLYHGLFQRTQSYFERSSLASTAIPADAEERKLLKPFPGAVTKKIMDGSYQLPTSDGSGRNRKNWKTAIRLLAEAGYELREGKMRSKSTNEQLSFEMLAYSPSQERVFLSFTRDLKRIGIAARTRVVDSSQYQARLLDYDYDIIQSRWRSSLSPGNEQLFRWSSQMATRPGTYNFAGVKNPAADEMIQAMLRAKTATQFKSAVHALDRVLLSGFYVIPLFHLPKQWLAHWNKLAYPKTTPIFGYQLDTWWQKPGSRDTATKPRNDPPSQTKP